MRTIVFPPKTHKTTIQAVTAIAWATNRRGRVSWKSDNVTRQLHQYLQEHGVDVPSNRNRLTYSLAWLDEQGYAERRMDGQRTRTLELKFKPDVDLTGFTPRFVDNAERVHRIANSTPRLITPRHVTQAVDKAKDTLVRVTTPAGAVANGEPPLPFVEVDAVAEVQETLYRWDDLKEQAVRWSLRDPDAWADWVDRVIDRLTRANDEGE